MSDRRIKKVNFHKFKLFKINNFANVSKQQNIGMYIIQVLIKILERGEWVAKLENQVLGQTEE